VSIKPGQFHFAWISLSGGHFVNKQIRWSSRLSLVPVVIFFLLFCLAQTAVGGTDAMRQSPVGGGSQFAACPGLSSSTQTAAFQLILLKTTTTQA
jgi:hypothetical protein